MLHLEPLGVDVPTHRPMWRHPRAVSTFRRFSTFASIGVLAAMVYAAALYFAVKVEGASVFLGSCFAFACGIPVSYFGNRRLTYSSRNAVPMELTRFLVAQGGNLIFTSAIVATLSSRLALPLYLSTILAYGIAPIMTWILFEVWVYKKR